MTAHTHCDECGRSMPKAHRVADGKAYCGTCYARVFKQRDCARCGAPVRAPAWEQEPVCRACTKSERHCIRCGRPAPKLGMLFNGKPVCPSCAPHFRAPTPCPLCGRASTRLSRVLGITEQPVCARCRRALTCATCSQCGKHRERYALTPSGKPLCKKCHDNRGATHRCPDCGNEVGGAGESPCLECDIARSARRKGARLGQMLRNAHLRELWGDFVTWAISRGDARRVLTGLQRYADALTRIDLVVPEVSEIVPQDIAGILTTEELRRLGVFAMFLAEQGLVPASRLARRDASEQRCIERILEDIGKKPWASEIRTYVQHLRDRADPLKPSTIRVYVRAAVQLLEQSGVASVDDLASDHVTKFLRFWPGHRASLHAWANFVKATTRHSIRLGRGRRTPSGTLRNQAAHVATLIAAISNSSTIQGSMALTAKLLATLYVVPLQEILSMSHDCVDCQAEPARIKLRGEWLRLNEPVADCVRKVAAFSADQDSKRLFPGRLPGDCLSTDVVQYHARIAAALRRSAV